jgi:hypothetical protein
MTGKTRLTQLAARLAEPPARDAEPLQHATALEANPPHGQKGDFVKVTVTLPPAVYALLAQEATRRKLTKARDPLISAIIREAVVAYLQESAEANASQGG